MTAIDWVYFVAIFLCAVAGGGVPFVRQKIVRNSAEFPQGEAFTSGVFLALALTMMLPAAFSLFQQELPDINYPVASIIALGAFLVLLAVEHCTSHLIDDSQPVGDESSTPAIIPVTLTAIIAMPSFFLGASLWISERLSAF